MGEASHRFPPLFLASLVLRPNTDSFPIPGNALVPLSVCPRRSLRSTSKTPTSRNPNSGEQILKPKRRTIEGSCAYAKQTAKLLRSVVSHQRMPYTDQATALIDAVKAVGEHLIARRKPCRKVPKDLTEGTRSGFIISMITLLFIVILFGMELIAYMSVNTSTTITVDKSPDGELLHISFDLSFPRLSCEFASVDLNDVLGTKRFNVTTSIHKYSIDSNLKSIGSEFYSAPLPRIENHGDEEEDDGYGSMSLTAEDFDRFSQLRDILVVNFYTPGSSWSSQLKPSWEKVAKIIRERYDPKWAGILMAKVDCSQEAELCRRFHVQAYPTIRIFRRRNDTE